MPDISDLYRINHRRQHVMLATGVAISLVCGLAPRNARALFVTSGPAAPKAFAVLAPPEKIAIEAESRQRVSRNRVPFHAPRGPDRFIPSGLNPGIGDSPVLAGSLLGDNFPGVADFGTLPARSASFHVPNIPGLPTAGAAALDDVSASPPAVGPLPEPGVWAMLLIGFFGIGTVLRVRSRNAQFSRKTP